MKKTQVIWSREALIDLENIYDFLAEKSPHAAKQTIENILARTRQLETFPDSGSIQKTLKTKHKAYRYLVEGNYKIIYSYRSKVLTVYIETIFDTRQDPGKLEFVL